MNFTLIGALLFFLISLAHLARVIFGQAVQVTVGTYVMPMWPSIIAFLVTLLLAIMLYKEGKARKN
jgi:hypothetical protein